jgi:TPR repeat protein
VDKHEKEAAELYRKAASKGLVPAVNNLGLAYEVGRGH